MYMIGRLVAFVAGALFSFIIQAAVQILFNNDEPVQVRMSTFLVREGYVQILGSDAIVSWQACEEFRLQIHNPPDADGDENWTITTCEIIDIDELDDINNQPGPFPFSREVHLPRSQASNQQ